MPDGHRVPCLLQWGRGSMTAESFDSALRYSANLVLQWGRGSMTAERWAIARLRVSRNQASMGPRFNDRGKSCTSCQPIHPPQCFNGAAVQ